jgi:hypothetical protein
MWMTIHLDLTLPSGSSSLPEGLSEQPNSAFCLALLPMRLAVRPTVASGPVVSYTAVSPLPDKNQAVCFLLRFLSGRPGRTLSAIVLCGARKFLNHAE